jgi:hypothetical protein
MCPGNRPALSIDQATEQSTFRGKTARFFQHLSAGIGQGAMTGQPLHQQTGAGPQVV